MGTMILKTLDLKPVGYILQNRGMIVFRMTAQIDENCELYQFFQDECFEIVRLECAGEESSWAAKGELAGAVISAEGQAIAHSGVGALRMYEKARILEGNNAGFESAQSAEGGSFLAEFPKGIHEVAAREHPARRWPPPPCCPSAQYTGGKWHKDGMEII